MDYLIKLIESIKGMFFAINPLNFKPKLIRTSSTCQSTKVQSLRYLVEESLITTKKSEENLKEKTRVSSEILNKVRGKRISETDGLNHISSNQIADLSLYQQKTLDLIHNTTNHQESENWDKKVLETIITRIAIAQAQMENFLSKSPSLEVASLESLLKTQIKIEHVFTDLRIAIKKTVN